ncbi:MAG: hypothetical protein MUC97_09055 [Bernardetiaceae bacterium]|jgi:hypothetical protein|nr:hypothetical protein [Bernardetiaceae bacterium]
MAYRITLEIEGNSYELRAMLLDLRQIVDEIGRPATTTRGGVIRFSLADGVETDFFVNWMVNPHQTYNGEFTYYNASDGAARQRITFTQAVCVEMAESYNIEPPRGAYYPFDPTTERFSMDMSNQALFVDTSVGLRTMVAISSENLRIGNIDIQNRWPRRQ